MRQEDAQVTTLDELGDDERTVRKPIEVDDLQDVAVMQTGGDPRLVDEHERRALVRQQLGANHLDHERALEAATRETHLQKPADARIVVHDEDPGRHGRNMTYARGGCL